MTPGARQYILAVVRDHLLLEEAACALPEEVVVLAEDASRPDVHQRLGARRLGPEGRRRLTGGVRVAVLTPSDGPGRAHMTSRRGLQSKCQHAAARVAGLGGKYGPIWQRSLSTTVSLFRGKNVQYETQACSAIYR